MVKQSLTEKVSLDLKPKRREEKTMGISLEEQSRKGQRSGRLPLRVCEPYGTFDLLNLLV